MVSHPQEENPGRRAWVGPCLNYMLSLVIVKTAYKGFKSLLEFSCICPAHSSSAIPSWFFLALQVVLLVPKSWVHIKASAHSSTLFPIVRLHSAGSRSFASPYQSIPGVSPSSILKRSGTSRHRHLGCLRDASKKLTALYSHCAGHCCCGFQGKQLQLPCYEARRSLAYLRHGKTQSWVTSMETC